MQETRFQRSDRILRFAIRSITIHSITIHSIAILPMLALALAAFAPRAHAGTEAQPRVDAVKLLREHVRAKDADAIRRDLEAISAAYPETEKKGDRIRMLAGVAKVLRMRNEGLQSDALDAFEEMGDPKAWIHYNALLAKPFKNEFPRLSSQAMDVTRALKPEPAVSRLLGIARKSKNLAAAAKAIETLGAYRDSRQRAKILGEIIAVTRKEKPGVRGRDNTIVYGPRYSGSRARNRWQALSGPMVDAANELTGRDLASPDDWFTMWRKNKKKPTALFRTEQDE